MCLMVLLFVGVLVLVLVVDTPRKLSYHLREKRSHKLKERKRNNNKKKWTIANTENASAEFVTRMLGFACWRSPYLSFTLPPLLSLSRILHEDTFEQR